MLDSWRANRDDEGWKVQRRVEQHLTGGIMQQNGEGHPDQVYPVPRLAADIRGLLVLLASPVPPKCIICSTQVTTAFYGFGDASGSGFGDVLITLGGTRYRYGLWGNDLTNASSNYRELFNLTEAMEEHVASMRFPHLAELVQHVEKEASQGLLTKAEMFLFTDNAVAAGAFFKGTSSNKQLFGLILCLKKLEFDYQFHLHVIHIAGSRMQAQGTDALSRGSPLSLSPLHRVLLHLSALECSSGVLPWCLSWIPKQGTLVPLLLKDWFYKGYGLGEGPANLDNIWMPSPLPASQLIFLWSPPPAAGDAAIEQLSLSRHKCPGLAHIFICPRLMTHLWWKRLFKHADLVFTLPTGHRSIVWSTDMHEPLVLGIFLSYLLTAPWIHRNTPAVLAVASQLHGVWSSPQGDKRRLLRQLWDAPGGSV